MFNTIVTIISAAAVIYLVATVPNKKRITTTDLIALLMSLLVFVIMCRSDLFFKDECDHTAMFDAGYSAAIEDAELVDISEHTYKIQFGDDVHYYTTDDAHLVDIKNINE